MVSKVFIQWLSHFTKYVSDDHALLIMNGSAFHIDDIVGEAAENSDISLLWQDYFQKFRVLLGRRSGQPLGKLPREKIYEA